MYEFGITGTCSDNDPESFDLIATDDGYIPIFDTEFFEFWKFAERHEIEIEITTKFQYVKMKRWQTGLFSLLISGVTATDAATFILRFGDYISRDY